MIIKPHVLGNDLHYTREPVKKWRVSHLLVHGNLYGTITSNPFIAICLLLSVFEWLQNNGKGTPRQKGS